MEPQYISRFFFIYFTVTGVKKIVHYTEDFVSLIEVSYIVLFQNFKKVAQRSQAILIRTTKEYTLTLFFCGIHFEF